MKFGLTSKEFQLLTTILSQYIESGTVIIYGSRVKNSYTKRSDVDLVIKNSDLTRSQLSELIETIEESDFPYLCDLQLFESINNPALINHIDRVGEVIYPVSFA